MMFRITTKKWERKDCKMASRISLLTHPRLQREFSSSTGRLHARHRSPACPPSRRRPNPSHPGRCLANRSRLAIDPILIYPHHRRRADHPARWRKMFNLFQFSNRRLDEICGRYLLDQNCRRLGISVSFLTLVIVDQQELLLLFFCLVSFLKRKM